MIAEHASVVPGIRDEQDGHFHIAVPQLRLGSTLQELHVPQSRLGIDADARACVEAHVPCPLVTEDADRRLDGPPEVLRAERSQTLDQPQLPGVTHGEPSG